MWRDLVSGSPNVSQWIEDAGFTLEDAPSVGSAGTTWIDPPVGMCHGAAWMAIGDAAATFDPLSSHGMTTALWSGARVVDALTPWLANAEPDALTDYANAVSAGVLKFRTNRAQLYGRERRFTGLPFWDRRSQNFNLP